ncbi:MULTISPECIES: DUF4878 domain-containing protein [unclassified Campylobacter]|uniref:DUF4878 domain-containing protein n=1 Tax=unclassified Campylobacter TaxID=2593542 RepID=UPI00123838C9|nr:MULTISPECIES: DUF4878 domain-containing protein [unclassified Campylobacter]KAA6224670.1 DUF4878 domain-containing protein [Campylobacter sp. LR185c]KAA6225670.1 DUF4878 domain-containing protein [Campylobacter sp. LR286c]KAA6229643.1 DUF4878 domain-containing protein [Campylobacter sp. LR291e]KAA8603988.1 hypothetical protein CGP82_04935 [Campylobacter sp. LR185c]
MLKIFRFFLLVFFVNFSFANPSEIASQMFFAIKDKDNEKVKSLMYMGDKKFENLEKAEIDADIDFLVNALNVGFKHYGEIKGVEVLEEIIEKENAKIVLKLNLTNGKTATETFTLKNINNEWKVEFKF